jgi:hypothetical protein
MTLRHCREGTAEKRKLLQSLFLAFRDIALSTTRTPWRIFEGRAGGDVLAIIAAAGLLGVWL